MLLPRLRACTDDTASTVIYVGDSGRVGAREGGQDMSVCRSTAPHRDLPACIVRRGVQCSVCVRVHVSGDAVNYPCGALAGVFLVSVDRDHQYHTS